MSKSNEQTIPYTYLIGWKELNLWYYGVRYAKGCNPLDLWNPYKTSSNYVRDLVNQYGKPTIIQVRRIFESVDKARNWETTVLKRIRAVQSDKWINKNDSISIDLICIPRGNQHWTRKNSDISERMKRKDHLIYSEEAREKCKGDNHYTRKDDYDSSNFTISTLMKRADIVEKVTGDNHYTHKEGYDNSNHYAKRPEVRERLKNKDHPFTSKEVRTKAAATFKGHKFRRIICEYCGCDTSINQYPKWHGDKCKNKWWYSYE